MSSMLFKLLNFLNSRDKYQVSKATVLKLKNVSFISDILQWGPK